ncbi:MAG: hypothetical protein ACR2HF_09050 [Methylococcaceae bacterium]
MRQSKNDPTPTTPAMDTQQIQSYIDTSLQTQLEAFKQSLLSEIRTSHIAPPADLFTVKDPWDGPIAEVEVGEPEETMKAEYAVHVHFNIDNDQAALYLNNPHIQQMIDILTQQSMPTIDFTGECPFSKEQVEPYNAFMFLKSIDFIGIDIVGIHPHLLNPNKEFVAIQPDQAMSFLAEEATQEPPDRWSKQNEYAKKLNLKTVGYQDRCPKGTKLLKDVEPEGMLYEADFGYRDQYSKIIDTLKTVRDHLQEHPSESDACVMRLDSASDTLQAIATDLSRLQSQMHDLNTALTEILTTPPA